MREAQWEASFKDIDAGSAVGSCSLKSGELDRACLAAKACGKNVRENSRRTGKLLMSECVYVINAVAKLHDELSVSSLDTFRDTDNSFRSFSHFSTNLSTSNAISGR